MRYEYLLLKRNGNPDGLIYDHRVFTNSKDARKEFRKNDTLLKCKKDSIFYTNSWIAKAEDIIKRYDK